MPMSTGLTRALRIGVGAVLFGVLMSAREQFVSTWARILLAAAAGALLAVLIVTARSRD